MLKTLLSRTFLLSTLLANILVFSSHCFADDSAVALLYHHVDTTTPASTSISPELFLEHLNIIEQQGFSVLPLTEIVEKLANKQALPKKAIAITFDDGYISIYENAYPELKKRKMPFTVFINPQAVKKKYGDSMTWLQLKEIQANGATIANHGNHHQHLLARLDNEDQQQWLDRITLNIQNAQQSLQENLGITHKLFAYPYGEFDQHLVERLKELNYIGFGQQSGGFNATNNFQALPRFPAAGVYSNPHTLLNKIESLAFTLTQAIEFPAPLKEGDAAPRFIFNIHEHDIIQHSLQCYYEGQAIPTTVEKAQFTLTVSTQAKTSLSSGRHRYNCTAKSASTNQYYWLSMPYVALKADNSFAE